MNILAQEEGADRAWDRSTQYKLNRMRVLSGEADTSRILVVDFMNIGVDYSPMQEAMGQVEEEVLADHEEGDLEHYGFGIWEVLH